MVRVQTLFRPAPLRGRPVKTLRTLLAMTCAVAVMAGPGVAQNRPGRGPPAGMGRGGFAAPNAGRGGGYASPRFAVPAYGRGGPGYGSQRFAAPPAYGAYPAPYRGASAFGGGWSEQQEFLRDGVRQGQLAPLGRVIGHIRQLAPGRELDAGLEYQGPRLVYRVRWMTPQGRRVDYIVDAASGAIVSRR
jgi:hypothetical protein